MNPHPNQFVVLEEGPYYGFDDKGPYFNIKGPTEESYRRQVYVDPAPAYAHDITRVREMLAYLQSIFPLPIALKIALLTRECVGRTNGNYDNLYDYDSNKPEAERATWYGVIQLIGKRIPIHPAMTRYLCAHEYGHGVQYCIERARGLKSEGLESLYQEQFRPETKTSYGPGHWHNNIGELIANDFRILVAKTEDEFWPHEGHPRPETIPALVEFWAQAQKDFLEN